MSVVLACSGFRLQWLELGNSRLKLHGFAVLLGVLSVSGAKCPRPGRADLFRSVALVDGHRVELYIDLL